MTILPSALTYISMLVSFVAAFASFYSAISHSCDNIEKKVVYVMSGGLSLYFFICYTLSLVGIIGSDTLGPCYLNPALLALFFTLIWHIIVDRNLWWHRKL